MKRFGTVVLAFFALLAASCQSKEDGNKLVDVSITADILDYDVATKAAMTSVSTTSWEPGDVIKVTADGQSYTFVTVEGGSPAIFVGSLPEGTTAVTATYPSSFELPVNQMAVKDGLDAEVDLLEAKGDISVSKSLSFSHAVALVRVTIESTNVKYITVTSSGSELADGSSAIRVMSSTGKDLDPGSYYAAIYPVENETLSIASKSDRLTLTKTLANTTLAAGDNLVIKEADVDWTGSSSIIGPDQFIMLQASDWQYNAPRIASTFGSSYNQKVGVGEACMFYIFERSLATLKSELENHLSYAESNDVPVLVELDPITFWDNVPEIWNWFDTSKDGYNDANRENVEWTGWSSDYAVKIGWLNWGSLCRLAPMCNLFSPTYQAAVKERMTALLDVVDKWYNNLSPDKKYLLVGVKVIGEFAFGWNNWYYPNGNDYYGTAAGTEPSYGLDESRDPSFGMQQMGYAALTYSGIKTSGTITSADIVALEKKYQEWIADIADDYSFSRDMLFSHAGCVGDHLSSCMTDKTCPSWSFYESAAYNAKAATDCMSLIKQSEAPYWAVSEWAIGDDDSSESFRKGLSSALDIANCRYVSIFQNVVGNYNNSGDDPNENAIKAIKAIQSAKK